jgi:hypothetical protein
MFATHAGALALMLARVIPREWDGIHTRPVRTRRAKDGTAVTKIADVNRASAEVYIGAYGAGPCKQLSRPPNDSGSLLASMQQVSSVSLAVRERERGLRVHPSLLGGLELIEYSALCIIRSSDATMPSNNHTVDVNTTSKHEQVYTSAQRLSMSPHPSHTPANIKSSPMASVFLSSFGSLAA